MSFKLLSPVCSCTSTNVRPTVWRIFRFLVLADLRLDLIKQTQHLGPQTMQTSCFKVLSISFVLTIDLRDVSGRDAGENVIDHG